MKRNGIIEMAIVGVLVVIAVVPIIKPLVFDKQTRKFMFV